MELCVCVVVAEPITSCVYNNGLWTVSIFFSRFLVESKWIELLGKCQLIFFFVFIQVICPSFLLSQNTVRPIMKFLNWETSHNEPKMKRNKNELLNFILKLNGKLTKFDRRRRRRKKPIKMLRFIRIIWKIKKVNANNTNYPLQFWLFFFSSAIRC